MLTAVSVVIAFAGIGLGFFLFSGNPLRKLPKILEDKWRVDELYDRLIIWPINAFSTSVLWKIVDVRWIDGLVNGVADSVRGLGGTLRYLQTGVARSYVAVILFGAAILIGYFMLQVACSSCCRNRREPSTKWANLPTTSSRSSSSSRSWGRSSWRSTAVRPTATRTT